VAEQRIRVGSRAIEKARVFRRHVTSGAVDSRRQVSYCSDDHYSYGSTKAGTGMPYASCVPFPVSDFLAWPDLYDCSSHELQLGDNLLAVDPRNNLKRLPLKTCIRQSAFAFALLAVAACAPTPPSDTSIIARFNAHRAEFNQLLEMFDHDGIDGRLGCADSSDDARHPQPISPQRRAEYAQILTAIGCDGAVYYTRGARAQFIMWSVGLLFAGQDKSIVFSPGVPPAPVVESTDGYHWTQMDHDRGAVELYRHIDGPWYLGYVAN